MPLSRRYMPEKDPAESCNFGMNFDGVIPGTCGIAQATLAIFTNTQPPLKADADWTVGDVKIEGGTAYAMLSGGKAGIDYLLKWTAVDTDGNTWPRTALCLVANTS